MYEEAKKTKLHKAQKEEQKLKIVNNRNALNEKVKIEVYQAKEEKHQTKELFYHQKDQHLAKASMIKQMIKAQQEDAKVKKVHDMQEKKVRAR